MKELIAIREKYTKEYVRTVLETTDEINRYATAFYKDAAEIFDCITRIKNTERNPAGYSLEDAPILGLLIRVWKCLKEAIRYHEENNAEFLSLYERPIIEASVIATYLQMNDGDVISDFRRCSYKDRLRILRDLEDGSVFLESKAGKRLVDSVYRKLSIEGISKDDFAKQKENKWRLQGKNFFQIFEDAGYEGLYHCTYGIMSESIHGSWNDVMDFCLTRNEHGNFDPYPFFHDADVRYISPLLLFCVRPYRMWIKRIDSENDIVCGSLEWIEKFNGIIYHKYDEIYGG